LSLNVKETTNNQLKSKNVYLQASIWRTFVAYAPGATLKQAVCPSPMAWMIRTQTPIRVLFTLAGNDKGLRGHSNKICKPRFNTDIRKYFFSNRVIDRWNSLDRDTVDTPSL